MVNQVGLSRKHIFDAVENSVRRLGTYIDVLQIHRLDRDTPMEEIMKALNDVVESGKVRYIGASSMAAWEFQMLQNVAAAHGWHQFISMQNYHNLIYREEEREMLPYCAATGVGCIPWSPIGRGVLARPWSERSTQREQSDNFLKSLIRSRETETDKRIVERVEEVAKKRGVSMAQVATAWVLKRESVFPIVGLGSKERIDEAVGAVKLGLTDEEARYLEEPYVPKVVGGIEGSHGVDDVNVYSTKGRHGEELLHEWETTCTTLHSLPACVAECTPKKKEHAFLSRNPNLAIANNPIYVQEK